MNKIYLKDFHRELLSQNEEIKITAHKFLDVELSMLTRRPKPYKWSVMECFEHMNILYNVYIQNINTSINNSPGFKMDIDYFKPTRMGHYFYLSMVPNEKKKPRFKIKTFKRFKPNGKTTDHIMIFLSHHKNFIELINNIPDLDLNRIKVNSSLGRIMRFKLGDIFRIVTGHNQRHIIQAENTLKRVQEA